jgi:protein O-GlcNAc transferase
MFESTLTSVLLVSFLTPQLPSRDVSVSTALAELNRGRVLESIEQFKQILRSDSSNGAAYFYLSTVYTQMGEIEIAERYVRRAMELNPKQSAHYLQLGLIRFRQKQWRPALELFQESLALGPGINAAAVWRSIGDVQVELFDREAARQAYETSLRLRPQDAATRLALGRFYLDRSESDRAIEQLRAALEIDPKQRAAYSVLGRAYRQSGDLAQAIGVLRKAVDADSTDQDSRYALAQALLAAGREGEGREELEKYESLQQQVSTANAKYKDGQARLEAGKPGEAEPLLREAIRLAPRYGPALHSLGVLLLDRGSLRNAEEFLKRAIEVNPINASSWFNLARVHLKNGKLPDALDAVKRALVLDDENEEYQRLLGDVQQRIRR